MSFPRKSVTGRPQIIKTDKYELHLFHGAGIIKFYKRTIELGEIVRHKKPAFTFRLHDFRHFYEVLDQVVETLTQWRNQWRAVRNEPTKN